MVKAIQSVLAIVFLLVTGNASAMDFTVEALFKNKAMIKIDGKRVLLKAGQEKNGLTLVSTDTYKQIAVIEIDGKSDSYDLGRHIGGGYAKPEANEIMISADRKGSYFSNGQINGRSVNFLLDTGASSVAMSEDIARGLGLNYLDETKKIMVATAGGNQLGYQVILREVSVGGIVLYNVEGIVITGSSPSVTLLGMSFLSQLEIEQKQNLMVLRKKF
jgi:aspartyl protease family protein